MCVREGHAQIEIERRPMRRYECARRLRDRVTRIVAISSCAVRIKCAVRDLCEGAFEPSSAVRVNPSSSGSEPVHSLGQTLQTSLSTPTSP